MKQKSLPNNIIIQWPEILSDVTVVVIPIQYTHSLKILFKSGKIWDLDIANKLSKTNISNLTDQIAELMKIYDSSIERIDFHLDVERLKNDSIKSTNKFFKIKNK